MADYSEKLWVDIAAAGEGSRLRPFMDESGHPPDYPKHLLLTGVSTETLAGRIVQQCLDGGLAPRLYVNHDNAAHFASHPDIQGNAELSVAQPDTAFGPFMRRLVGAQQRTLGAAGDHFADGFKWADFLAHHERSRYPVTFAVSTPPRPREKGAVFDIDQAGGITRFYRPDITTATDSINVGLYIFDPDTEVLTTLADIGITPESLETPITVTPEQIVTSLIRNGLVGAYRIVNAFNINDQDAYADLRAYTGGIVGGDGATPR